MKIDAASIPSVSDRVKTLNRLDAAAYQPKREVHHINHRNSGGSSYVSNMVTMINNTCISASSAKSANSAKSAKSSNSDASVLFDDTTQDKEDILDDNSAKPAKSSNSDASVLFEDTTQDKEDISHYIINSADIPPRLKEFKNVNRRIDLTLPRWSYPSPDEM